MDCEHTLVEPSTDLIHPQFLIEGLATIVIAVISYWCMYDVSELPLPNEQRYSLCF